ncbi:GlxA family transcriptional regulator [Eleftheria terrae]|uniref:GlxA family transcriptional regulator n=1 Tax=Eleftheria terrae TaxID=1597781 RepID=UPI00263B10A5|nr:helix-turn-helix domain-containing protein [Eleftheria terrae]WKB53844.1 helix-turn-helix domain-containing protein [Eleftheria terrae]
MPLVRIWAVDGALSSGVAAPVDIFLAANHLATLGSDPAPQSRLLQWKVESLDGKPVRTASGQILPVDGQISGSASADAIWLTGPFVPDAIRFLASRHALDPLLAALQRQHERGALLATYCTGSFLLAEAGLLHGKAATTHWSQAATFRSRYPDVRLKPEEIVTEQAGILCSAAVTSYHNLALRLVEKLAHAKLAMDTAKLMLIDRHRDLQSPYAGGLQGAFEHGDDLVAQAQRWMAKRLKEGISISELSRQLAVSERTLNRRFKQALGEPPVKHLQSLRIEMAKRLFETTRATSEVVCGRIGYSDVATFRELFKRHTGVTPSEYRRRFGRR